ncbi:MFS transporter (plasmid) [Pantoea agglomerans]|uniref:MFS transporter n=1 Tax=Enterobacter agglomerans TaxID=549 RepID=UPI002896A23C|nr:MFS transporter [Pantoea agglomerans]WNK74253.1 MFS transporter [Pantoea agglomerans]
MIGRILNTTTSLAERFVRSRVVKTPSYKEIKWSIPERCILTAATYPVLSVVIMFAAAFIFLYAGLALELPIKKYVSQYFPYRHSITEWQTTILSGQLTIIGIVYPLVVGLVSVVFQRKADRKIAQKAYQHYSGFMLAGLSGLFLSGFILLGVIIKMVSGDYAYGLVCLISLTWLFINIVLSIWFFIVSLEMLDDTKRQHVLKRYISLVIVEPYVIEKMSERFRAYPVYPARGFSNLNVIQVDHSDQYIWVTSAHPRLEQLNVFHRPFTFLLGRINRNLIKSGVQGSLIIGDGGMAPERSEGKVLFGLRNISEKSIPARALKLCFFKTTDRRESDSVSLTLEAMTADTYLSLLQGDVKGFEDAMLILHDDFATLCNIFSFVDDGKVNNFLLLKIGFLERSLQNSFSGEVYKISNISIEKIAESERFFELCLWANVRLFNSRGYMSSEELDISMEIVRSHWSVLTGWCINNYPLSTATLRSRYDRLTRTFATVWEIYQDKVRHRFADSENAALYEHFCSKQLQDLPAMVLDAMQTRDPVTADAAVDLLNRWQHSMKIESHAPENYRYDGLLFSPGIFKERKLNSVTDSMWFNTAMMNGLTDMRICVSLYLTSRMNGPDEFITHYVRLLLNGSLTDHTGGFETLSEEISHPGQLLTALVRICLWTWSERMAYDAWLNGLARRLSDYDKPDMVSGRIYGGVYDSGFTEMTSPWVQLLLTVSAEKSGNVQYLEQAIAEDYISYREKQRLIGVLSRIKDQIDKEECIYHLKEKESVNARQNLLIIVDRLINVIKGNLDQKLRDAAIDPDKLAITAEKTTNFLSRRLERPLPLSLFRLIRHVQSNDGLTKSQTVIKLEKESYAKGIDALPVSNEGDFQAEAVASNIQIRVINQLLQTVPVRNVIIDDFIMLLGNIKSSPEFAGKNVLVMSKDIHQQYNNLIFDRADVTVAMKTNRDGSRTLTTEFGTCKIYFMPYVNRPVSLVVDDDYFSALLLRKYESGSLVEAVAENVRSDSDQFDLVIKYEISAVFKGDVSLRIEHPKKAGNN